MKPILAIALITAFGGGASAQTVDCSSLTIGEALVMPMPDLKMKEPMPTGMARDGTMKEDVTHAAAAKQPCMDMLLKQDQQTLDKKPAN